MSQIQANHSNKHTGVLWRLLIYYSKITKEFLRSTILNGLKYLTLNYLTICEKLFFLCCLIAAFCISVYFAKTIVEKWQTSPVLTVMNPETTFITDEPFPAITICNMNKAQYSNVKDFNVESLKYAYLQKVCHQELNYNSYVHLENRSDDGSLVKFILKNSQPCSDMLVSCKYGNIERTCSDFFREVLLDEGLCCTFNVVHPFMMYKGDYLSVRDYTTIDGPSIAVDWNPENGYPKELPKNFYPRVPMGAGIVNGFILILNGDLDNYYCSSTNGPGFKVAIHSPIDAPNIRDHGFAVNMGVETSFRITPSKEESHDSLKTATEPKERQCYFSDEYSLIYYRYYTRSNCEMECDAKFVLRKCNCLPYFMPLVSNNASECHVRHFDCVSEAEMDFVDQLTLKCKMECLPSCNEFSYIPDTFFIPLSNDGFGIKSSTLRNIPKERLKNYALFKLFFPQNYYRGNLKNPSMSFTEFLSQVGGIMSLMMGFSIISLVEIIYFFVIKPFINCWDSVTKNIKIYPSREYQNQNLRNHDPPPNMFATRQLPIYGHTIDQLYYMH